MVAARTPAARDQANAALTGALRALDKQRASIDAALEHAITTLSAHAAPPTLPG